MIITFFGHSDFYEDEKLRKPVLDLLEELSKEEEITFYLGGYGNFDGFALYCAKEYKKTHPNCVISFISPYLGKWLDDRREYFEDHFDEIISTTPIFRAH